MEKRSQKAQVEQAGTAKLDSTRLVSHSKKGNSASCSAFLTVNARHGQLEL
jgi:hypothetical protein